MRKTKLITVLVAVVFCLLSINTVSYAGYGYRCAIPRLNPKVIPPSYLTRGVDLTEPKSPPELVPAPAPAPKPPDIYTPEAAHQAYIYTPEAAHEGRWKIPYIYTPEAAHQGKWAVVRLTDEQMAMFGSIHRYVTIRWNKTNDKFYNCLFVGDWQGAADYYQEVKGFPDFLR